MECVTFQFLIGGARSRVSAAPPYETANTRGPFSPRDPSAALDLLPALEKPPHCDGALPSQVCQTPLPPPARRDVRGGVVGS